MMDKIENVDKYIADFPEHTRKLMEQLRETIKQAAPEAKEVINYGMPAYKQNGILLYFAAYKNHIGFYPMKQAIEVFNPALSPYKLSKGTIRFPLDKPLPLELIAGIVKFRVNERSKK